MTKQRVRRFVSRSIIAAASILVPRWRRRVWRETWEGEVCHSSLDHSRELVRRSTGAVSHAAWLRLTELSSDGLLQDVRYGLRSLRNQPGFTAIALLVLTLGIGANTTIFSLVNGLLVRPLGGIESPEQLVGVWRERPGQRPDNWSYPNYLDIKTGTGAFEGSVAYADVTLTLRAGEEFDTVPAQMVSRDYFEVLGVNMVRGVGLAAPAGTPDVVISHGAWQRRFGGDDVVGRTIELNGVPLRVAGVSAASFLGLSRTERPEAWVAVDLEVPLGVRARTTLGTRGNSWLRVVARRKPGASMEQARAAAALTTENLRQHAVNREVTVLLAPANGFAPDDAGEAGLVLGTLMSLVGLVLLLACANVANLLLARGRARAHEYGVRLALGASRGRLVRQMLVESLLLSIGAAIAGLIVARWSAGLMVQLFESVYDARFAVVIAPDARVILFSLVAATGCVLAFGLAPAIRASRQGTTRAIHAGATTRGRQGRFATNAILISQVALSLVVLVAAVLFARSLQATRSIDSGMTTENLLVITPQSFDPPSQPASLPGIGWRQELYDRIEAMPAVDSLAWTQAIPLTGEIGRTSVSKASEGTANNVQVARGSVSPGYFHTTGISLLAGRDFAPSDSAEAAPVTIVNDTLAGLLWPDENAVGRTLYVGGNPHRVVGVATTTKHVTLTEGPRPFFYLPLAQHPVQRPSLIVRSSTDPASMGDAMRATLAELSGSVAARRLTTMDTVVAESFGEQVLLARVIGLFGVLALTLALAGAYGVTSYLVNQRTGEIGIRMALGARSGEVMTTVVRGTVLRAAAGVVLGTGLAAAATPALASLVPGVAPTDPLTFALAAASLLAAVAVAGFLPARRASRVDPVTALRHE
jgi:predicted permease